MPLRSLWFAGLLAALAAGCNQARAPAPVAQSGAAPATHTAAGVTPSTFRLPEGAGCAGEVARYRAVMENDLKTGHVGQSVHDRVTREIDQANAACSAGRDADAIAMVNISKTRHGYR